MTRKKVSKQSIRESRKQSKEQERRKRRTRLVSVLVGVAAVVIIVIAASAIGGGILSSQQVETILGDDRPLAEISPAERLNYYDAYPDMIIDTDNDYEAVLSTSKGEIRLKLFDDESPQTVNSFAFLASEGFYDGLTFHRVIAEFMAQGGDPTGQGFGGPGYQFEDETDNGLTFDRPGLLAMANSGPNTNGSQFFITYLPTPHLDGAHTIFGEIIEGADVLTDLALVQPGGSSGLQADVIERIDIIERQ
jgi:cyclophilin family peptidyl-prolyl cis-trans isomerase